MIGSADPAGPSGHGGSLEEARRLFPGAPEPFIDLSTGINPNPYAIPPLDPALWTRLPEPGALRALQAAAARAYGVADPACVVAAPGTQIVISLLPFLRPARRVAILGPTYGEYGAAWRSSGLEPEEVGTLDALARSDVAVVCRPNNPDGRREPAPALLALASSLARRGGLLVVDEAFADLDPGPSLVPHLPHSALLVLRSFGKSYGLAGLRLGFALAAPPLAGHLRGALGPWAVSGPASEIGAVALADRAWIDAARRRTAADSARLRTLLEGAGLRLHGGTSLFTLAAHRHAPALFDHLGRAGLYVRRFAARPEWLRFGLPPPGAWPRLEAALAAFRPRTGSA